MGSAAIHLDRRPRCVTPAVAAPLGGLDAPAVGLSAHLGLRRRRGSGDTVLDDRGDALAATAWVSRNVAPAKGERRDLRIALLPVQMLDLYRRSIEPPTGLPYLHAVR